MSNNEIKSPSNNKTSPCLQSVNQERNISRRTVIRKLAIGSAALAGCSILPEKWTAPILEFGSLPAHATTSGVLETSEASEVETSEAPEEAQEMLVAGTKEFSLVFIQTVMPCDSCGIWFDSANLVIEHSDGTFTSSQSGSLLIKETRGPGYFSADLSSISSSSTIENASLIMSLNAHEGIANSDNSSVIEVYDNSSGSPGDFVRTITAKDDIKGKGYDKGNPNVPIDFTDYAKQVHGN
ncbi:Twin-arginine translocation signal domain-containing protein [Candidatus Electrothrix laxa]